MNKNRWIPVNDRLPEIGESVLACFKDNKTTFIFMSFRENENDWNFDNIVLKIGSKRLIATHWMPRYEN